MKVIPEKPISMSCKSFITANLIWLISWSLPAQNVSETRSYIKSLPVGKETSLEVSNKYGNIYVTPWSKDSAYIKAEIKAFASNEAKLKKMFDGIIVNINESKYVIIAQTEFVQNINNLFEGFKGMTNKLISYESRVEINYYISVPEYLDLKISNKYGDVFVENCTGDFSISISNGSFKAGSLGKGSSVSMTFCDATVNSLISGNIDAYFSEVNIDETLDLTVKSISSRYNIKKAGEIRFESRRDKFFIDNIESMKGNSYFTDYDVKNVEKNINLTTRYGKMDADLIATGFERIFLNSGYSDISLHFNENASYSLDIRHINTFLVLPSKNIFSEQETLNAEKKEYRTTGTVGKNPGSAKVEIEATRGNIYLK
jgi:hypothetical protein